MNRKFFMGALFLFGISCYNSSMTENTQIKLFEDKKIRSIWDKEAEEWYFSVVDVVAVLTES